MSGKELSQRNAAKKVEGQQSHEASDGSVMVAIPDDHENVEKIGAVSTLQNLEKKWKEVKATVQKSSKATSKPRIQKVPELLERGKKDKDSINYFEPRVVSIGPIHHHTRKLEMNEHKVQLAAEFIGHRKKLTPKALFDSIKTQIADLKKTFKDDVLKKPEYDDDTLSSMFVEDGCFILEFINDSLKEEGDSVKAKINRRQAALIKQDLFLLENQIPFKVLEILMEAAYSSSEQEQKKEQEKSIETFIQMNAMSPYQYPNGKISLKDGFHLLDLLRSAIVKQEGKKMNDPTAATTTATATTTNNNKNEYKRTFRNLQDLKTTGINVEPSSSSYLGDVSFSSFYFTGSLKLPPLIVDDSTKRKLFNLVAYEMCPDSSLTDHGVSCYLYFLDSLVDSEEDAKDLRMANIIRNRLSSDGEVAQFFNDIGRDLVPSPAYVDVKIKVQEHYGSKVRIWMAQAYNLHFSSPWTVLALVGAIIALVLTAVQTWFSIPR